MGNKYRKKLFADYHKTHVAFLDGEVSCHLYSIFPELFRKYGFSARFALLVRNPVDFIRSALTIGFFNPQHPNVPEHVVPPKDTAIGSMWNKITPIEKCAFYWSMVNGMVNNFFRLLPDNMYRIIRIETISIEVLSEFYEFLGFRDFNFVKHKIRKILAIRYNASPGQGEEREDNPYSKEISLAELSTWFLDQINIYIYNMFCHWRNCFMEMKI